jgi:hypothetical protein
LPFPPKIPSPMALPEQPTGPKPRTPRMSLDTPAVNGTAKQQPASTDAEEKPMSAAAKALRETNKSKFDKMKQQRNAFKEQLSEAVVVMTRLRCARSLPPPSAPLLSGAHTTGGHTVATQRRSPDRVGWVGADNRMELTDLKGNK